jgi:hypothetical protein
MNRMLVASVTLAVAIFACRDSGGGGDDVDAPVTSDDVTIQDIQSSSITAGTAVKVKGVIVTAIDTYGGKTGDIWVQEPGGGEFSGVHVYGAELADIGALQVGDVVDIEGAEKDEFAYMGSNGSGGDTSGRSVTELKPIAGGKMKVTKVSSGAVPAPQVVDALAIGQKATQAERDAEWEKWEGVYIKLVNVTVQSKPECVGSMCNDETLNKFDIVGEGVVESALAPFPGFMPRMGTTAPVPSNLNALDCLGSVTGVVDYFFDYLILNTEIQTGGTGCPAAEATAQACADGIDNDGNGFSDCNDNNCIVPAAACHPAKTISEVQATTPMGGVELQNVYVTAVAFNKKDFWVSSGLTAAASNGIYVRSLSGAAVLDPAVVVGARVNVIGKVTEGNNDAMGDTLTQISRLGVTVVAAPTTPPVPAVGQSVTSLKASGTGEPYESVLVTLTNVKVMSLGTSQTFGVGNLAQSPGTVAFKHDDDVYRFVDVSGNMNLGKCYSTITGIWTYSVFENEYLFLPRAAPGSNPATPDGVLAANQADCAN